MNENKTQEINKIFEKLENEGYEKRNVLFKELFGFSVIVLRRAISLSTCNNAYMYDEIKVGQRYIQTKSMIISFEEYTSVEQALEYGYTEQGFEHLTIPNHTLLHRDLLECISELQKYDFKEVVACR